MHLRIQFAIAFILCISLLSCHDGSKTDKEIIQTLEESLKNSNELLISLAHDQYTLFSDKLVDVTREEKAKKWQPVVEQVKTLSSDLTNQINKINKNSEIDKEENIKLYNYCKKYETEILNANDLIKQDLSTALHILKPAYASEKKFSQFLSSTTSIEANSSFLQKLRHDIAYTDYKLLSYINLQVDGLRHDFRTYATIINQNSKVISTTDELEIIAGVGSFSKAALPKITIAGEYMPINESGYVRYKSKTTLLGEHSVPVQISYIDENGKQITIDKLVKFVVTKPCD